jgi:hypothetical protein
MDKRVSDVAVNTIPNESIESDHLPDRDCRLLLTTYLMHKRHVYLPIISLQQAIYTSTILRIPTPVITKAIDTSQINSRDIHLKPPTATVHRAKYREFKPHRNAETSPSTRQRIRLFPLDVSSLTQLIYPGIPR